MKNKARLPRTAGLRTLTELTADLTKAGLDPSRIQERAIVVAKMRGATRKRKRDDNEDGMDVDNDEATSDFTDVQEEDGGKADTMEIDGEDRNEEDDDTPRKRGKANSGAVIAGNRVPHSNRQLAGLRDEAVRLKVQICITIFDPPYSKLPRPYGYEISASVDATCLQKRARATGRSESKW